MHGRLANEAFPDGFLIAWQPGAACTQLRSSCTCPSPAAARALTVLADTLPMSAVDNELNLGRTTMNALQVCFPLKRWCMLAVISLQGVRLLPDRGVVCVMVVCDGFIHAHVSCRDLGLRAALPPLVGGAGEQFVIGRAACVQDILPLISCLTLYLEGVYMSYSPFRRVGGRAHHLRN